MEGVFRQRNPFLRLILTQLLTKEYHNGSEPLKYYIIIECTKYVENLPKGVFWVAKSISEDNFDLAAHQRVPRKLEPFKLSFHHRMQKIH